MKKKIWFFLIKKMIYIMMIYDNNIKIWKELLIVMKCINNYKYIEIIQKMKKKIKNWHNWNKMIKNNNNINWYLILI